MTDKKKDRIIETKDKDGKRHQGFIEDSYGTGIPRLSGRVQQSIPKSPRLWCSIATKAHRLYGRTGHLGRRETKAE